MALSTDKLKELEEKNKELAKLVELLRNAMRKASVQTIELKAENQKLKETLEQLRQNGVSAGNDAEKIAQLEENVKKLSSDLTALCRSCEQLEMQKKAAETENTALQKKLQDARQEHDTAVQELKRQIKALQTAQKEKISGDYEEIKEENVMLREQIKEQARKVKSVTKQLLTLRAQMETAVFTEEEDDTL